MKYLCLLLIVVGLSACGAAVSPQPELAPNLTRNAAPLPTPQPTSVQQSMLQGSIAIDGSSTVFPLTEFVAHQFRETYPLMEIQLGVSGTGGGFKRFCVGETVISDASRPIKASEIEQCYANGVEFIELPIAYDGISVLVHPSNTWASCLTVAELRALWTPDSAIETWHDLRADWPQQPIHLYGAGSDSGTFDYFTAAIVGEEGRSRTDYIGSEDDYLLVQDIAADPLALGFFGFAYYQEFQTTLKALAIDSGAGCVLPSVQSITSNTYQPLARPMFIYVNREAFMRPGVAEFVRFYLAHAQAAAPKVGSVALPARAYELGLQRVNRPIIGSMFSSDVPLDMSIEQLLELEDQTIPGGEQ